MYRGARHVGAMLQRRHSITCEGKRTESLTESPEHKQFPTFAFNSSKKRQPFLLPSLSGQLLQVPTHRITLVHERPGIGIGTESQVMIVGADGARRIAELCSQTTFHR